MQLGVVEVAKPQVFLWASISFLIGVIIGTLAIFAYEAVSFNPWKWKDPPIVLNCYGEDMSEEYIIKAVHYWTLHGERFSYIENNPSEHICKADHIQGFILIKMSTL